MCFSLVAFVLIVGILKNILKQKAEKFPHTNLFLSRLNGGKIILIWARKQSAEHEKESWNNGGKYIVCKNDRIIH